MRYYPFSTYLREKFGERVHRVSLNAGFTCPNRDGTLGVEGCIYCNEEGFSRFAGTRLSLSRQIEESIGFARKRYGAEKFIAYFQNGTNTYAPPEKLKAAYDAIKDFPDIVGLFVSTRPDSVSAGALDLLGTYAGKYDVWIEYGVQTVHDRTLYALGRAHNFEQTKKAINETAKRGIRAGAHIILGLPGESEEDMMETARRVAELPVSGIKFHVLHVLRGTRLEDMMERGEIKLLERDGYVDIICRFLELTPADRVILRLVSEAKDEFLVGPEWVGDKQRVIREIESELEKRDTFQGRCCQAG